MNKNNKAYITANRKGSAFWAGLSFAVPAAVIMIIMAVCEIVPFGENTLINERSAGWFDSFCRLYQSVTEGESIFYHFNTGFGGSFYSDFASGLCSPFMFTALFFRADNLAAAYSVITVLRAAFAGLFAWIAVRKMTGSSGQLAFAAACGYALCGFTACSVYYPSIADGLVFFPLFVMGIYVYVNELRSLRLFIYGALFFVTCPDLIIGGVLISFVFYFVFYFQRGSKRQRIYRFAMFSAMIICSAAASALLTLPMGASAAYYGSGIFPTAYVIAPEQLASALCFGGYAASAEEGTGWLCLAGMLIMGIFGMLFNSKVKLGEKLSIIVGTVTLLLSAMISPLGTVLFGYCSKGGELVNAGSGFMLAMIAVYCTVRNFESAKEIRTVGIVAAVFLFEAVAAAALILNRSDIFAMVAELGLAIVFAALFVKVSYDRDAPSVKTSVVIAAVITFFGALHCFADMSGMHSKYKADELTAAYSEQRMAADMMSKEEEASNRSMSFFRYRSVDNSSANGVNLNQNDIADFKQFARRLGIIPEGESGGGENFTPLTDVLFGVRYVVEENYVVLYNDAELSPAYVIKDSSNNIPSGNNAFEFQNDVAWKWFGVSNLFLKAESELQGSTTSAENEGYKWTFGNENTYVKKYSVNVNEGETLYLSASGGEYMFAVNSDSRSAWQTCFDGGVYEADAAAGECEIYIAFDSSMEISEPIFMTISDKKINDLKKSASEQGGTYISCRGNSVKFMLKSVAGGTAVTSVPCEYGWEVTVNGEKAETFEVCGGLIGIKLEAGSNSVVMKYRPPFFKVGLIISVIMIALGLYMAIYNEHEIYRRRKVRMAFRAMELNLERQSEAAIESARELCAKDVSSMDLENQNTTADGINKLAAEAKNPYEDFLS